MAKEKDITFILRAPTTDYYGAHIITALSEKTLRNLVSKKKIPYYKLGRAVRFSVAKLNAWMEERAVEPLSKSLNGRGK